jgi:RNA polymerase sigma-70 factor (ECF subfamily)
MLAIVFTRPASSIAPVAQTAGDRPDVAARPPLALVGEGSGEGDAAERELVARVQAGESQAFGSVYRQYHRALVGFVAGYVESADVAEEIVQDLLCRIWEQRARWEVRGTVRAYLYLAARNRVFNHVRRRKVAAAWEREAREDLARSGMGEGAGEADARVRGADLVAATRCAVAALPARCREVYELRHVHHLSRPEIAEAMGISVKGVEIQLTNALKRLRAALGDFF